MNTLSSTINDANEGAGKRKDDMKTKISEKIPKLKKRVDEFNEAILQDKFLDQNSNMYDILNEIEVLEQDCKIIVEKSKKIEEFEKTLEMDNITKFDYVEEARINMMYRARLWRALNEWSDLVENW